jgi:hypothetical protein
MEGKGFGRFAANIGSRPIQGANLAQNAGLLKLYRLAGAKE